MAERMDELGLDFSVVYPSMGLPILDIPDAALRRACCRALNQFHADVFQGTERRLAPVAVIPMDDAGGGDRGARVRGRSRSASRPR